MIDTKFVWQIGDVQFDPPFKRIKPPKPVPAPRPIKPPIEDEEEF